MRLPNPHCQKFLERVTDRVRADARFTGLRIAGSALNGQMDEFSDLDLVLTCRPEAFDALLNDRRAFAVSCGHLLLSFPDEPARLTCLFNDPLLRVNLEFVVAGSPEPRIESPSPEWFEARFWVWLHAGAQTFGRGEICEAIEMLAFLRKAILGAMNCRNHGRAPRGLRRVEEFAPDFAVALRKTLCSQDRSDVLRAFNETVGLYLHLRASHPPSNANEACAQAVLSNLRSLEARH